MLINVNLKKRTHQICKKNQLLLLFLYDSTKNSHKETPIKKNFKRNSKQQKILGKPTTKKKKT